MTEGFDAPLDVHQVGDVLDFASPGIEETIAEEQLRGTTALYNILCRERVAYLADEVGMGKTYQALGVIALTWLMNPSAKILVITPRKAVQQKWNRDYRNFVSTNIKLADNRLIDPLLQTAVHRRCFCSNTIEFGKQVCQDPHRLFLTRLTSYSWVARSLGVLDSDEPVTGQAIARALRNEGLYVDSKPDTHDQAFKGSTAQNVEVARQMATLLPRFDLVVVDEAQKLRNKGSNIRTLVLNALFGFYPWTDPTEVEDDFGTPPRLLLLSATPAHRSEHDIYRQLSYASAEALQIPRQPWKQRQAYLDRLMVRRLRRLAGYSKYDYRRENPVVWDSEDTSPRRVLDELFVAYVQRELQAALERDSVGARLEVGFLESFESYEPSELDTGTEDDTDAEPTARSTHYEAEDDTVAPDHRVLSEIARDFAEATDSELPPHPKQRLVDEVARHSFEADRPEKLLIFVRRLASVRELTRRICRVYDRVTLQRLSAQIGAERIRSTVQPQFHFDRFETADQFRIYAEKVLGAQLEDAQLEPADESRDDDSVAHSRVLEVMRRGTDETTPGDRLLRRLAADNSLASVFEENLVRLLFRQIEGHRIENYDAAYRRFCTRVCDQRVRSRFNEILTADRAGRRGDTPRYFGGNNTANSSRIRALIYELVLQRAAQLHGQQPVVSKLLRIHRTIHGVRHDLGEGTDAGDRYDGYIDDALDHRSFWDIASGRRHDSILLPVLRGEEPAGREYGERLKYREFIKRLVEKNIRVSDTILHLFVAYDRAGGADAQRVALELADILFGPEGVRTRHRIEELIDQGPAFEKLAAGRLSSDTPLYAESRWRDFDRQQPALGAMGSTSSRYPVIVKFNAPFFPDFVVATDVFREGVDLHLSCRRVWHFGMVANPGDIEQRSGRIDRYFSKVHRALGRDDTTTDQTEGQVHIEYPYLARTIDEQQVSRVLKRKLEVQRLMDSGLSVTDEIRLDLDTRSEDTARAVLDRLSELDSKDTTPFPADHHLEEGTANEILQPSPHPSPRTLIEWLTDLFGKLEEEIPLTQPIADSIQAVETGPPRGLPALTNMAVCHSDVGSEVVDMQRSSDDFREQPVRVDIDFAPATRTHVLRLETPLGDHGEEIAAALQRKLHTDYAATALRLHYRPDKPRRRRHWRLMLSADLVIPNSRNDWPNPPTVRRRLLELAEVADELEWHLLELADVQQDLSYEQVRQ